MRHRVIVPVLAAAAALGALVPLDAASAAVTLTVTADAFGATARPGRVTVITVTVMAGEEATTGPVTTTLTSTGGRVVGVDNLGYPVTCRVSHGAGTCTSDGPLGSSHVFELAVSIKVNGGGRDRLMTLRAAASSPSDGASGSDSESVPITHG
jgi:hypothetical protein